MSSTSENQRVERTIHALQRGGLVVLPTETVYGLCAAIDQPEAIEKIFQMKGRKESKPLNLLVADLTQVAVLTTDVSPQTEEWMQHHWPGPLTLICKKSTQIPEAITRGRDTVGLRMPDHPFPLALIRALDKPLVATSANRSGQAEAYTLQTAKESLDSKEIALWIDGGTTHYQAASTIVDTTTTPPILLREGPLTKAALALA